MQITITTDNCDHDNYFLVEASASSEVKLEMRLPLPVSVQSRKTTIDTLVNSIQEELSKFKWIICGSVQLEMCWYLCGVQRQETVKVGDIDNISKPIQDALIGPNGILVDDSQIGSLHTYWMTRNDSLDHNVLVMRLSFNNDDTLFKKNLIFVRYYEAMCMALNIDTEKIMDMVAIKVLINQRLKFRKLAKKGEELGISAGNFLIVSTWDFHRTRLNEFDNSQVITIPELNKRLLQAGIDFLKLASHYRALKKSINKKHHQNPNARVE
jgi:Holliday junction resolvase RusA-like endonuclease